MNREDYIKLKEDYKNETMFLSFHSYDHKSLKIIDNDINKIKLLPIIKQELINDPSWFDMLSMSFIEPLPKSYYSGIEGRFDELKVVHISFLTKKIRQLKLDKLK